MVEKQDNTKKKKMSISELMKISEEKRWDKVMRFHPKQVLSFESYNPDKSFKGVNNLKMERTYLHIGKVSFEYTTNRGTQKSDIRIFMLDYKPTEEDVRKEFDEWINNYNDSHHHRPLLNHQVTEIYLSSIGDTKILNEIRNLEAKDKKRIIVNNTPINNTSRNYITIDRYEVEYTTDRNKRRKGEFLIPIAGLYPDFKIWGIEIRDMINSNRQRKVSNVKILGTYNMSLIWL